LLPPLRHSRPTSRRRGLPRRPRPLVGLLKFGLTDVDECAGQRRHVDGQPKGIDSTNRVSLNRRWPVMQACKRIAVAESIGKLVFAGLSDVSEA
jgi:hypothetical protein